MIEDKFKGSLPCDECSTVGSIAAYRNNYQTILECDECGETKTISDLEIVQNND